jgi:hypothetical protein
MVEVNYLAVLLCGVAAMGLGFAWYGPLFGKAWMKAMGHSTETMKPGQNEMTKIYSITFVLSLVTAYVLAHAMFLSENFFHYPMLSTGLITAFWMWLGFVLPLQVGDVFFGGRKWSAFKINASYQLVNLLVMGAILGLLS